MARPPRIHYRLAVYHVMARGNDGQPVFRSDGERAEFLQVLADLRLELGFEILAYCLMDNHFHLLLRVGDVPLARIMQRLLTLVSRRFNLARGRTGHVFQSRYKAILVLTDAYLLTLLRYIHLNPVKAGLVKAPEAWPWSSCAQYLGPREAAWVDCDWPLSLFGGDEQTRRRRFRDFMMEPLEEAPDDEPPAPPDAPPPQAREASDARVAREPLESLAAALCGERSASLGAFLGPGRDRTTSRLRSRFLFEAVRQGRTLREAAAFLGISPSAATRALRRWHEAPANKSN